MWIPRSQLASWDESERQQCGCGSPHIAWLSGERRPHWAKRLQPRWKKSITGLEEIAVYKTARQEQVWGILKLEKLEELQQCLPASSQNKEQIQKDRQTRRKPNLEKIWQDSGRCPAREDIFWKHLFCKERPWLPLLIRLLPSPTELARKFPS